MSGGQSADKTKSIGFACGHCGQKLTVSLSRAGQRGQCPKCRRPVVVPIAASETSVPTASRSPPQDAQERIREREQEQKPGFREVIPPPVPAFEGETGGETTEEPGFETVASDEPPSVLALEASRAIPEWMQGSQRDESPWVFVESQSDVSALPSPTTIDASRVNLPRYVVFAQGIALGLVAIVAFALGMLAGNSGRNSAGNSRSGTAPCVVVGTVEYRTSGGTKFPDEGAVVLLFPQDERPGNDERAPVAGLRPQDPLPAAAAPSLQMIRLMGAFHVRADRAGQFRIPLARGGKYYLLVVSTHGARRAGREPGRADLAAIGRYVASPDELVGDRRYRWRSEDIQRDTELSVVLD